MKPVEVPMRWFQAFHFNVYGVTELGHRVSVPTSHDVLKGFVGCTPSGCDWYFGQAIPAQR